MSSSSFSSRRLERRTQEAKKSPSRGKYFLILVGIFLAFSYYISATRGVMIPAWGYTIAAGTTLATLNTAQKLDIVDWRYRLYVKFFAPKVTIRAGYYETTEAMTLEQFLTTGLEKTTPTASEITLTFLPGWNIWDMDAYLASKSLVPAGEFVATLQKNFIQYQADFSFLSGAKSVEGFLVPDTYRVYKTADADMIARTLLKEFQKKYANQYTALDASTAYKKLILASIVEREERSKANRPIVAGILEKRTREGIAMGADATVCYGFEKTQKECTPAFVASVIADHSNPYNTRKTLGYPPTPISSISESSWQAALTPESSPYYYYLHDNDGIIRYAKTLAEHNANVQKYLR